jgi:hypothetical protein
MTTTIQATIQGRRLEVEVPADWPEGAEVEIHSPIEPGIQQRFRELVAQWKEETRFLSSIHDMVSHAAYLQIIGMGKEAVPLLLDELRREPDHWFVALQAITGTNPIPSSVSGDVEKIRAPSWRGGATGIMSAHFEVAFPLLSTEGFEETSPHSEKYNCIAWAAGRASQWGPVEVPSCSKRWGP